MKAILKIQAPDRAIAIGLVLIASFLLASADTVAATANSNKTVTRKYGALPLAFEANLGQTAGDVSFLSRGQGYSLFITRQAEAVLVLRRSGTPKAAERIAKLTGRDSEHEVGTSEVLRVKLLGAQDQPASEGLEKLPGASNYFLGRDPSQWHANVPLYAKVKVREVYPGVDVTYYGNGRQLEEDFIVAPGADPVAIRMIAEGASKVSVDPAGELVLTMKEGEVRFHRPVAYQETDGVRHEIASRYVIQAKNRVGFELGAYDRKRTLVIDPPLSYSTYLGGSDSDNGNGVAVDSAGNAYLTGETASTNFPTTTGAAQTALSGNTDVYVTKLNPTGTGLVYSTYLGGSGRDTGRAIAVDPSGNAYVTGATESANFPSTSGVFQSALAGTRDGFVAKLNATGSALVYSSYLGGAANQDVFNSPLQMGLAIAADAQGNAYVSGETDATDFPVTVGAFQTSYNNAFSGTADAFVTKVNPTGSALIYSTYLGSGAQGFGIAIDSSGSAYVGGLTEGNFPTTAGAYQTTFGGAYSDAFVTKLNAAGTGLVYSTYIGGSSAEQASAIAVDTAGNAYITGIAGTNYPVTGGAYQPALAGFSNAFVTKLNATGSALVYSTYLGGTVDDQGFGIAVDGPGNAYVVGMTNSPTFPTTANAAQPAFAGGYSDAFLTVLNPQGAWLIYLSYLGGSGANGDLATGVAVDSSAGIYVTGSTSSSDFPTTAGAFQTTAGGSNDVFVTKIGGAVPCTPRHFVLDASMSYFPPSHINAFIAPQPALEFALPAKLPVIAGNAGTGTSLFAFDLGSGVPVICGYTGANAGAEYDFVACTQSGLAAGSLVTADKILMTVLTARPPLISTHFPGQGGGAKVEVTLTDATCP
jgi:hypothetical protein